MQNNIFLGLGSNIGDRLSFLRKAYNKISGNEYIEVINISSIYETDAWGIESQNAFLNLVIEVSSALPPNDLLQFLKYIEISLGRKNRPRWTEREIDVDIIFYGNKVINDGSLIIPHPEMHHRNFVLIPMCELNEEFIHPVLGVSVRELLKKSEDKLNCTKSRLKI